MVVAKEEADGDNRFAEEEKLTVMTGSRRNGRWWVE